MDRVVDIFISAAGSLVAVVIVFIATLGWQWFSDGGVISFLGGVTKKDIDLFKEDLSDRDILYKMRSTDGAPTTMTFVNGTTNNIVVYWIDRAAVAHRHVMLGPGERHDQNTYVNHGWIVRDAFDNHILYTAKGATGHQTVEIRPSKDPI